jgi:hypothetical protein
MQLALRKTVIIEPRENDYVVVDKDLGIDCGRIYRGIAPGGGDWWLWFVQAGPPPYPQGTAARLEDAKAAFRAAWELARTRLSAADLARIREEDEQAGRRGRR